MNRDIATVLLEEQMQLHYPEGLVPVRFFIPGRAFFPGGRGVFQMNGQRDRPPIPVRRVMVVGRDFDTELSYVAALEAGEEEMRGTWENMLKVLKGAAIEPQACFFTNAFMGLRADPKTKRNTGVAKGHRSREFKAACQRFFLRQVELVQPRLVLCLGPAAAAFLAGCADLPQSWLEESLTAIDGESPGPLVARTDFHGAAATTSTICVLTHPSMRPANVWRRRYRGFEGIEAERVLLADAYVAAFENPEVLRE